MSNTLQIPKTIEGIESALEEVELSGSKSIELLHGILKRERIIRDYKIKRDQGKSSEDVYKEIAMELNLTTEYVNYVVKVWQYR